MSLSRQHESKPVTAHDRVMSQRHLAHRAEVEKMPDSPKKKALSRHYNLSHAKEHLMAPSMGKAGKKLAKGIEKIQKKTGLSLSSFVK